MNRGQRNRARLAGWHRLETRSLLSAVISATDRPIAPVAAPRASAAESTPVVPGNQGHIQDSQFQSGRFGEVGSQWRDLSVGGPIRVHLVPADLDVPPPVPLHSTINTGNIEHSQFNPFGFSDLGTQLKGVRVHGGLTADVTDETLEPASGSSVGILGGPVNSGDVIHSQFNDSGFGDVGLQMQEVGIGGHFAIHSNQFVRRNIGAAGPLTAAAAAVPTSAASPTRSPSVRPDASINRGLIQDSQFNDGGFGDVGMQWDHVHVGGSVGIGFERWEVGPRATPSPSGPIVTVVSPPNGSIGVSPLASVTATFTKALDPTTVTTSTFTLQDASGRAVAASVGYGASTSTATLTPSGPLAASMIYTATLHGGPSGAAIKDTSGNPLASNFTWTFTTAKANAASENATNIGQILHSQMSDGGFGDIGFQWRGVRVSKDVATSYNTLSIQPKVDNSGPITADGLTLGQAQSFSVPSTVQADPATSSSRTIGSGDTLASAGAVGDPPAAASPGAAIAPAAAAPSLNESTNSGRIFRSQAADGGFGDIGLQWHHVKVHGSVKAVHNSLSVQPENTNQGLIKVNNIHFPSKPAPLPPPSRGPLRELSPTPPLIEDDGAPVTTPLPQPTRPFDRTFDINQATNSGNIITSQFADGGFGDFGLQWLDVGVHNNVQMVHNSLSVHPEGNNLAGVHVSDVSFGDPALPPGEADRIAALRTNLRPSRIEPPVRRLALLAAQDEQHHAHGPDHVNDRLLNHVQLIDVPDAPIVLQWQKLGLHHGLVVINNIILLDPSPGTGPIALNDIRFPGMPPINATIGATGIASARQAGSGPASPAVLPAEGVGTIGAAQVPAASPRSITDQATSSGILVHNQFSGGGFGDVGMQWRKVHVAGPVSLVHNTLSVDVSGENTGLIDISNVVYNSGTLTGGNRPFSRKVIAPPPFYSRVPFFRRDRGSPLPHDPNVVDQATNSGILLGGQFSARGLGHVMLQWRGITVPGPVTVMDNVLAITTGDHGSGPITISHVTFA